MSIPVPQGFQLAGVHCGIKRNPSKHDLALVVSRSAATAAGVYTQNLVFAAPVAWNRRKTPNATTRVIAINSGNANACTGERGDQDCARIAELAATACGASADEALVLSTGMIGEFLPMEKIAAGIQAAAARLGGNPDSLLDAARGMMTTDNVHKVSGRRLTLGGREIQISGMAKGAAMIGPRMATMLCVLLTDAALETATAQQCLTGAVDESFNCISVDGHMSTNDTVLLLANAAAGGQPLAGADLESFRGALTEICVELAKAIPSDGEGATHLVTIDVTGCTDRAAAHKIAKTIGESPLVKTAIAGGDPNWGRIVSAAGYAGVPFDPAGLSLRLNGYLLYERRAPVAFDSKLVSNSIRKHHDTLIELSFSEGSGSVRFWTTDLTAEYVRLNADYHT